MNWDIFGKKSKIVLDLDEDAGENISEVFKINSERAEELSEVTETLYKNSSSLTEVIGDLCKEVNSHEEIVYCALALGINHGKNKVKHELMALKDLLESLKSISETNNQDDVE